MTKIDLPDGLSESDHIYTVTRNGETKVAVISHEEYLHMRDNGEGHFGSEMVEMFDDDFDLAADNGLDTAVTTS